MKLISPAGGYDDMKRIIALVTLLSLTAPLLADGLEDHRENTEELYRTSAGSDDTLFSSMSTSMVGWGIGLAIGIAVLASVLNQSGPSHSTTTTNNP